MPNIPLENPQKLRELAAWYRAYAERANTPWVCEADCGPPQISIVQPWC